MNTELFIEYKRTGDLELKEKITLENIGLVKSICNKLGYTDDLLQEGIIILMRVIDNFDLDKKTTFESYVYRNVKQGLLDYLAKNVNYNGVLSRRESKELSKLRKIKYDLNSKNEILNFEKEFLPRMKELEQKYISKSLDAGLETEEGQITLSEIIGDNKNNEDYQIFKMDMEKLLTADDLKIIEFMSTTKSYIKCISNEFKVSERTAYNYVNKLKEKMINYFK